MTSIGSSAFGGCSGLTSIIIPESVSSIENYVFSGCTSLKKLVIEDRENTLTLGSNGSESLFSSCPLEEIYIGGNISFSSGNTNLLSSNNKKTLRHLQISGTKTEISSEEFSGCTELRTVRIGNSVTNIGNSAFKDCSKLYSLEFGSKVKTIGSESFSGCRNMKRIISRAQIPPTCGSLALYDIDKFECTLYVPKGTVEDYRGATPWVDFFFIEEGEPSAPGDANGDGDVTAKDAEAIADYIMGVIPDNFDEIAADANEDGFINVADIVYIYNIINENKK